MTFYGRARILDLECLPEMKRSGLNCCKAPALHRLIKRGWIAAEEGVSENNRRAKFYRLTPKGRRQLSVETGKWETLARAIGRILRTAQ